MISQKVFFIDTVHPILESRLKKNGFETVDATLWDRDQILNQSKDAMGLVIRSRFTLDEEFLSHFPILKFIARSGSGLENIDVDFCHAKNIQLFNSPEGNRNAVAEHALGMLLSLMNHLNRADRQVKQGQWNREENRGEELDGKTVGIIGFGNNGSAFARKLKGFDVKILAYDKYKSGFANNQVQECTLEALLTESDVISLHIPQNSETKGTVNDAFIANISKPVFFLNLSRGSIVDTAALVRGIESGKIKAAALDVLEYESHSFESAFLNDPPPALNALMGSDKVLLSPHVGGWSAESYFKLSDVLADKILAVDWT